jgi:hypothetical protein
MQYGCLARVVREGGFRIALIARLSAIPGHCATLFRSLFERGHSHRILSVTTAVFSTCGMSVWTFSLAAFLSLPKQFATVYIGVIIEGSGKRMFHASPWHRLLLTSSGRGNDSSARSELLLDCGDHNHHFSRCMVHLSRTQACQARRDI